MFGVAGSTGRTHGDMFWPKPCAEQPAPVGLFQINLIFFCAGNGADACLCLWAQPGAQAVGHILVGLEAAEGDTRSDGGQEILRVRPTLDHQRLCAAGGDAQSGAPPTGVDGRRRPAHRVAQQHRNAVRGKDGQAYPWFLCQQSVGLCGSRRAGERHTVLFGDSTNGISVDLMILD